MPPSARREQLELLLAESPDDVFLQYGLAMETAREGDLPAAISALQAIVASQPDYVPAWFQQGQLLVQNDQLPQAREVLQQGIAAANRTGDSHAAAEMAGFLESF